MGLFWIRTHAKHIRKTAFVENEKSAGSGGTSASTTWRTGKSGMLWGARGCVPPDTTGRRTSSTSERTEDMCAFHSHGALIIHAIESRSQPLCFPAPASFTTHRPAGMPPNGIFGPFAAIAKRVNFCRSEMVGRCASNGARRWREHSL